MTKFRGNKVRKQSWNESFFFTASNVGMSVAFPSCERSMAKINEPTSECGIFSLSQDLYIPVDNICLFEQLFHRKKSMGTPEMT